MDEVAATREQLTQHDARLENVDGRQWQFTHDNLPGVSGYTAHLDQVARGRLILDDYSTLQNLEDILYPAPDGLTAANTVRGADSVTGLSGVLDYRFGEYWLQPGGAMAFTTDNPRPPAPAAFGGRFQVASFNVLNYFNPPDPDADQGDGQGCWNAERTTAAATLLSWLAGAPTGTADPDVLILGDLNSYALEDPIRTLTHGGYSNLLDAYGGAAAYSYVFDGQWGYLDYALGNAALTGQVTGAAAWHINADEPSYLSYDEDFKPLSLIPILYAPDPYRASDHDPVLIGLDLGAPAYRLFLPVTNVSTGSSAPAAATVKVVSWQATVPSPVQILLASSRDR
jgi:predicted extracellular nuclease